ncbi:metalloproteinase, extracellular matrix glycoprotein VMP14, partial [Volvox carteri f. nagariensis]
MGTPPSSEDVPPGGGAPEGLSNAPDVAASATVDVSGELMLVDTHLEAQWIIRQYDGTLTPVALGYTPPKTDDLGKPVLSGALVTIVSCSYSHFHYNVQCSCYIDDLGICNPAPGDNTVVLLGKTLLLPDIKTIHQRLLVIILDYSICGSPATMNQTAARMVFLGPKGDGSGGIAEKYTQCSHGKFNLNTTAFKVITVRSNCTDAIVKKCAYWTMGSDGETGARLLLGGKAFAEFTHFAYIIPPGVGRVCTWNGLASLPGKQIWLQSWSYGVQRWATVMQEALHNYGLGHSWQDGRESEDFSTVMGRGDACPNAAELAYLGWATPAPGGDRIDSKALPVGTSRTFNMPATYLSPNGSYLRVVPDWLPTYGNPSAARNLYMAVRVRKGGDTLLGSLYANKVNIHEVNATMDNNLDTYIYQDRKISFVSATPPKSMMNLTTYNLVIYAGSWVDTDVLRVHLCRYQASPIECPTLRALEKRPMPAPSPSPRGGPRPPGPRAITN